MKKSSLSSPSLQLRLVPRPRPLQSRLPFVLLTLRQIQKDCDEIAALDPERLSAVERCSRFIRRQLVASVRRRRA
jgi:hypothetical protein